MTQLHFKLLNRCIQGAIIIIASSVCLLAHASNHLELDRQTTTPQASLFVAAERAELLPLNDQEVIANNQLSIGMPNSISAPVSRKAPPSGLFDWLADNEGDIRSKADVVREVKQRYNARVLKISLDEKRNVYRVRILMPSGKVRNISLSAKN